MNRKGYITDIGAVGFATLIGLLIRLAAPVTSDFPLNDGGLFYSIIVDLRSNHFVLPETTSYNLSSIPFAYPPLAFYFYAALNTVTHIPILDLMRVLPAIVSAAAIPAFYLLAREIASSKLEAALATFIFALVPRAFDWLIMGGGVTRSLGLLFALLAMRQAYILFSPQAPNKAIWSMILAGGLVVCSHPEATAHTILSAIFFYVWKDRSRNGFFRAMLSGIGIAILTSPWWVTILVRHGLDPFLAAASAAGQDSYNIALNLFALFEFNFADEPVLTIISVLGLIGVFYLLARKEFFLALWFVIMHIFEPRGGSLFTMIPLALFAGVGLDRVILPALSTQYESLYLNPGASGWAPSKYFLSGRYAKIFTGFLLIYLLIAAYLVGLRIRQDSTLTNADLQAMLWVKTNTTDTSKFALVTGQLPLHDPISEWFPALAERQSVATVFGLEWINDGKFGAHINDYRALQLCANQRIKCLDDWVAQNGNEINYVFIHSAKGIDVKDLPLSVALENSPAYELVYDAGEIEIFHKK